MVRVYIGRLPNKATDRDVEHFFRGYGKLVEVIMKNGFGFVDFQDQRDADDAVHDLNGKDLCGERVILEFPRRKVGYNEDRNGGGFRGREPTFRKDGERQFSNRYSRPCSTRFRLVIDNLSTRYSWQDIKDHIRKLGMEPTYSEAHKRNVNQALVCFSTHDDLLDAMNKLQGEELNGRKLKCTDETRDRSRSRSPRRRSRSRSPTRSRSPPPRRRSSSSDRSDKKSRSASPKKRSDKRARSESKSRSRSRSIGRRSRTNSPPNRSPSPNKRRDHSSLRSGSASP